MTTWPVTQHSGRALRRVLYHEWIHHKLPTVPIALLRAREYTNPAPQYCTTNNFSSTNTGGPAALDHCQALIAYDVYPAYRYGRNACQRLQRRAWLHHSTMPCNALQRARYLLFNGPSSTPAVRRGNTRCSTGRNTPARMRYSTSVDWHSLKCHNISRNMITLQSHARTNAKEMDESGTRNV